MSLVLFLTQWGWGLFGILQFRGWSFLMLGTHPESWLWGSEIFVDKFMGVWNFYRQVYGGLKLSKEKLWGSEKFSLKCMGVPNFLWSKYGGLNFFREKIWGSEIFPGENSGSIGTFMFVVSPTEFCFSVLILFSFSFFDFFVWSQGPMRDLKWLFWQNFGQTLVERCNIYLQVLFHQCWWYSTVEIWIFSESIQQILVSSGLFIRYRVCYIYLWQLILYIHIVDTMYIPDMKYIFIYCVNHSFCCPLKFLVS